jgi:hypothetical protein
MGEFSACMFRYQEENKFEDAFNTLIKKLSDNSWLKFIYESKKKWTCYFMKDAYTLGIRSTQTSESMRALMQL